MTQPRIAKHRLVKIDKLQPYAKNARTHSQKQIDQISESIRRFGFTNAILIDEENNIIAGHGRYESAKAIGMTEVPAMVVTGLSDAERRALVIADNKIALNAGWDDALLKEEIQFLTAEDFDMDLIGFDTDEMEAMFPAEEPERGPEDDVPELEATVVSNPGDVWLLGAHRLMCGDSTDAATVAALMAGEQADQLLTDPPYNVAYEGKTKAAMTIKNDSMGDEAFRKFLSDAFAAAVAVMKPGGSYYIWHADSEGYNFRGACRDVGLKVRQCLIWLKDTMVMGRQDYHWKHEPCLYGWKDGAAHHWASDRKQTTIIECKRPTRSDMHPTMKPVELMEYQILNNTDKSDIVLDIFGGSGSTLIACEKTKRQCRTMELDPKYVDVIVRRWQQYTGQQATLQSDGRTFDEIAGVTNG